MNAAASNSGSGTAKGDALKTFAVNFIIAFSAYWAYNGLKEWSQSRETAKVKP